LILEYVLELVEVDLHVVATVRDALESCIPMTNDGSKSLIAIARRSPLIREEFYN
jgi:hypothetical protein